MLKKIRIARRAIRPGPRRSSRFSAVSGAAGAATHHAAHQNSVERHRHETGPVSQKEESFTRYEAPPRNA